MLAPGSSGFPPAHKLRPPRGPVMLPRTAAEWGEQQGGFEANPSLTAPGGTPPLLAAILPEGVQVTPGSRAPPGPVWPNTGPIPMLPEDAQKAEPSLEALV